MTPVPGQALRQGWWPWVCCCCARVWVGRGCVSVRPGFSMCVGVGPWGGPGAACSAAQEGYFFGFCGAVVLRCAVPQEAGTLGPAAGHGVAWPMEVEVGIFSLAWMGMEREGP